MVRLNGQLVELYEVMDGRAFAYDLRECGGFKYAQYSPFKMNLMCLRRQSHELRNRHLLRNSEARWLIEKSRIWCHRPDSRSNEPRQNRHLRQRACTVCAGIGSGEDGRKGEQGWNCAWGVL